MFRFPIHPMILIALKEANQVAKTSVDRRYHTLIQQRPTALGLVNFGRWFVFWVSLSYLYVLHYPKFVRHIWRGSKTKLLDKIR
jgi:hypothetical protein